MSLSHRQIKAFRLHLPCRRRLQNELKRTDLLQPLGTLAPEQVQELSDLFFEWIQYEDPVHSFHAVWDELEDPYLIQFIGVPGAYLARIPEHGFSDVYDSLEEAIASVDSNLAPFRKIAIP
jgi:hypothetical protein